MIFLKSNVLLEKDLTFDDIKPRLLGHWGTCPGLILVYAHLNRIVRKTGLNCLYVVGPGSCSSADAQGDILTVFLRSWCTRYFILPLA